jgi:hypothetical protein
MKLYHLFFVVFLIQVLFILPFQRNIEVWDNSISEEEAYSILRDHGVGPAITYPGGWVAVQDPGGSYTEYYAFYLGNAVLNFILFGCVVSLYKLRK